MATVRIVGSRAREQVPGTSITLLAPGFRGALTQVSPGVASPGPYELPFCAAAAGAEVTLAAQLMLDLEARTSPGSGGLRSRSAMVAFPRVIVPRRNGLAYALLQTDETGTSSFVLPATHDDAEAVFRLTIAAQGATRRALRVLMWPIQPVMHAGALALASRWERQRRPNQLAQCAGDGQWLAPDWKVLGSGPMLLLLHDTFSTPQAAFADWTSDASFARVHGEFGGRCLGFTHPTLATGLEENLGWLVKHLAPLAGPIDIVAHGRGGLLARALAADRRLPLRRVCQVGTPNKGTLLALPANLMRFLDAHVGMLAGMSSIAGQSTLEGALCMLRFVALGQAAPLPGIEELQPGAVAARLRAIEPGQQQWFTVSAQFVKADGHGDDSPQEFAATSNDLVVPAEACHEPGVPISDSLRIGGSDVHHHNYFKSLHVRERLAFWLR